VIWNKRKYKKALLVGGNTKGGGESSKKRKNSDRFSFLSLSHNPNTAFIWDRYVSPPKASIFNFIYCVQLPSFIFHKVIAKTLTAKSNKEKVKERKRKKETTEDRATTQREKERERERERKRAC